MYILSIHTFGFYLCMPIFLYTINIANKYCKVGKLWIPYIIFRNTDSDEAVTVTGDTRTLVSIAREGGFIRSGLEIADEVQLYFLIAKIYNMHITFPF